MYDPIPLLEATSHIRNLIEARRLMIESGLLTENIDQLAGMDKSLNFLDKEVDKAKGWVDNIIKIYKEMKSRVGKSQGDIKFGIDKYFGTSNSLPIDNILEKLQDLPAALHNIAQLDFGKEAIAGVKGNWAPGNAKRSIGDFFGRDSSIGKSMAQLEAIAIELGKITNLMKITISSIARALKFAKDTISLDEAGKSLYDSLADFDRGKTFQGMSKILKRNADQGWKGKIKAFIQDVNPLATVEPLFGVNPNDIIASWLILPPKDFMKLGPALTKPLNKGPSDLVKALSATQEDAEETADKLKNKGKAAPEPLPKGTEGEFSKLKQDLGDKPIKGDPDNNADRDGALDDVSELVNEKKQEFMNALAHPELKDIYEKAVDIIADLQEPDENGLYWPSFVRKIIDSIGVDQFYDQLSKNVYGKGLYNAWLQYNMQVNSLVDMITRAQDAKDNPKGIKTQMEEILGLTIERAKELKKLWKSAGVKPGAGKSFESQLEALKPILEKEAQERIKQAEEAKKQNLAIAGLDQAYFENYPGKNFDDNIKEIELSEHTKSQELNSIVDEAIKNPDLNFGIWGAKLKIEDLDRLNKDNEFRDLWKKYDSAKADLQEKLWFSLSAKEEELESVIADLEKSKAEYVKVAKDFKAKATAESKPTISPEAKKAISKELKGAGIKPSDATKEDVQRAAAKLGLSVPPKTDGEDLSDQPSPKEETKTYPSEVPKIGGELFGKDYLYYLTKEQFSELSRIHDVAMGNTAKNNIEGVADMPYKERKHWVHSTDKWPAKQRKSWESRTRHTGYEYHLGMRTVVNDKKMTPEQRYKSIKRTLEHDRHLKRIKYDQKVTKENLEELINKWYHKHPELRKEVLAELEKDAPKKPPPKKKGSGKPPPGKQTGLAASRNLDSSKLLRPKTKYSLMPIIEEDITYSLLQLLPEEKKVQRKPQVIVEKKRDILLERWQKLAGLE